MKERVSSLHLTHCYQRRVKKVTRKKKSRVSLNVSEQNPSPDNLKNFALNSPVVNECINWLTQQVYSHLICFHLPRTWTMLFLSRMMARYHSAGLLLLCINLRDIKWCENLTAMSMSTGWCAFSCITSGARRWSFGSAWDEASRRVNIV